MSLDLTHGFNRLVDNWFDLFSGSTAIDMSANVACAYPSEESVSDIWNRSRPEWYSLRWNQAQRPTDTAWLTRYVMVKLEWDLMVHWQGLTYERDDKTFYFIENCTASCRIVEPANMNLEVQAHFGHPNFYEGVATLPVTFHVKVDDDGTVIREEPVKWVISGQGHRERL